MAAASPTQPGSTSSRSFRPGSNSAFATCVQPSRRQSGTLRARCGNRLGAQGGEKLGFKNSDDPSRTPVMP